MPRPHNTHIRHWLAPAENGARPVTCPDRMESASANKRTSRTKPHPRAIIIAYHLVLTPMFRGALCRGPWSCQYLSKRKCFLNITQTETKSACFCTLPPFSNARKNLCHFDAGHLFFHKMFWDTRDSFFSLLVDIAHTRTLSTTKCLKNTTLKIRTFCRHFLIFEK